MQTMTDRYAVIGNPIQHSKSPLIHGRFAQLTGQDIEYTRIEAPLDGFLATLLAFRDGGGRGVNITTPFKLQAFEAATERSPQALQAGAVNAIKFLPDGGIAADNFDGVGLVTDLQRNLGFALRGQRVLLLGAGGAARGALGPLLAGRPAALVIANRTATKALALATEAAALALDTRLGGCGEGDLAGESFDLVINATSTGLTGTAPAIPPQVFRPDGLAYEMVYGRGLTPFLRLARGAGVRRLADGVGMLIEQAAEVFAWWRGVRPDTGSIITELTLPLV
jgi:shikimate dehydrogenase